MGWDDRGEIAVGKRADLLLLDKELNLEKVIYYGRLYFEGDDKNETYYK